jgi:hypothetical protein
MEALVSEMRADLKSLKDRLDDEVISLGIDGEKSDKLLAGFYSERAKIDFSNIEVTPPKRKHKSVKESVQLSPKQTRRRAADSGLDTADNSAVDFDVDANIDTSGRVDDDDASSEDERPQKRVRASQ